MENQAAEIESLKEELKWAKAKIESMKIDLDRWEKRTEEWAKETVREITQEWPRANSYWKIEGPKLQQRVLDLEMELENLRSRTQWKD